MIKCPFLFSHVPYVPWLNHHYRVFHGITTSLTQATELQDGGKLGWHNLGRRAYFSLQDNWCLKTEQLKMGGKTNAHILQHGGGGRLLALQKEAIWGAVWAQVHHRCHTSSLRALDLMGLFII